MSPIVVSIAVFMAVAALVGAIATVLNGNANPVVEERLDVLAGLKSSAPQSVLESESLFAQAMDDSEGAIERLLTRFGNWRLLFEQAGLDWTAPKFLAMCAIVAGGGLAAGLGTGMHIAISCSFAAAGAVLPFGYVLFKRKRRLKAFAVKLPDAMELLSRALRAGHSLAAGFSLVAEEMKDPIGGEFAQVFEEQNLGVSQEDALRSLADRVPNMDLRFFVTAIILQRQTGGDLAEILDKIGRLIRERFQIWGQIQALTGEGRLSGIVLLALPPALFLAVYRLNPDYVMVLFTDPLGQQMLAGGVVMQVLGALVIRKIINIKV